MQINSVLYAVARIVAALVLLQTLYFKFTGSPESVYIFTTVGIEPLGRIMVGIIELIAATFLLIRAVAWLGAILSLGLMVGATGMHLTILGIEVMGDGGYLFFLALLVGCCSLLVMAKDKAKIIMMLNRIIAGKKNVTAGSH